jgi:hypothetical protein
MDFSLHSFLENWIIIASVIGAVIVILIIISVVIRNTTGSSSVLILQEFNFNEHEDVFLVIKGRASGFWNWIKSLFNKAPITSFTCSKRMLKYNNFNIPMIKISCVSSAMLNTFRIILLIMGIIFIIAEIALTPSETAIRITLIIIGIALILCSFIKNKTMYLGVYLYENKPFLTLTLRKGIINSIDNETFEAAVNTLAKIVLANSNKVV